MKNIFLYLSLLLPTLANAEEIPSVKVLKAETKELYESYFYPASLEARQESEIYSEIDGVIKETRVKIGQNVKPGQVLMILRQSKPDYSYAPFQVKSPISGSVASIAKKVGSPVKQQEALLHIVNHDELTIKFEIPEAELAILKPGLAGELLFKRVDAPIPVHISGISPILNTSTGTASGELVWDDQKGKTAKLRKNFLPGMVGRVSFKVNFRKGISIPKTALIFEKKTHGVRVVEGDKVFKKQVKIGKETGDQVEIVEGLKEGDLVVTSRNRYLKEGEVVKIDEKEKQ